MSKAILVMDMPKSCSECPLFCGYYADMHCKGLNNGSIDYPYPKDFRQEWCPLKKVPSKKHHSMYGHVRVETLEDKIWNKCVDEILGT